MSEQEIKIWLKHISIESMNFPNYVIQEIESIIEELSNSKDAVILNNLNNYPFLFIKAHKSTKLTVTSKSVATMFGNEYLTFDYTSDKNGVLMCGALKNVYAILAGLLNLEKGTSLHEQFLEEAKKNIDAGNPTKLLSNLVEDYMYMSSQTYYNW